ncbi:nuclear protein Es2, partial [Helicosporidium sp. ATCC 50920]
MPPPPPRTRKRKEIVLEEEEWIARMDAIIRRDYFPELASLESKVEWLEALRSKDPERLERAQLRLIACQHPESARSSDASPWDAAPSSERGGESVDGRRLPSRASKPQSLDAFLASYTSEDNASFRALLDAANARRAAKNRAFFKAPDPTLRGREHQLLPGAELQPPLGLPGVLDEQEDSDALRGSRHAPMNALMFRQNAESLPLTSAELGPRGSAPSASAPSIAAARTRFAGGESGSGLSTALSTPGSAG